MTQAAPGNLSACCISIGLYAKITVQNRWVGTSRWASSRELPAFARHGLAQLCEERDEGHTSTCQSGSPPGHGHAMPRALLEAEVELSLLGKGKSICCLLF